jgi:hypothetical protein
MNAPTRYVGSALLTPLARNALLPWQNQTTCLSPVCRASGSRREKSVWEVASGLIADDGVEDLGFQPMTACPLETRSLVDEFLPSDDF